MVSGIGIYLRERYLRLIILHLVRSGIADSNEKQNTFVTDMKKYCSKKSMSSQLGYWQSTDDSIYEVLCFIFISRLLTAPFDSVFSDNIDSLVLRGSVWVWLLTTENRLMVYNRIPTLTWDSRAECGGRRAVERGAARARPSWESICGR